MKMRVLSLSILDLVLDFLIFAVPMAVIGARAYYVIFNYSLYQGDIMKIIAITTNMAPLFDDQDSLIHL